MYFSRKAAFLLAIVCFVVIMRGEQLLERLPKPSATRHTSQDDSCLAYCTQHPQSKNCTSCKYPGNNVTFDVKMMCSNMPDMVGCSLMDLCFMKKVSSTTYCSEFSVLGDICTDGMMGKMKHCKTYVGLCSAPGTAVSQCADLPPLPGLLSTSKTIKDAVQACSKMDMPGCQFCKSSSNCEDPLKAISMLCQSMYMEEECSGWRQMCSDIRGLGHFGYLCGDSSYSDTVEMRMYFHSGIKDYIWFKGWVPQNTWEYFFTAVFVALLGMFTQFLKALRAVVLRRLRLKRKAKKEAAKTQEKVDLVASESDEECHMDHTGSVNSHRPSSSQTRNILLQILADFYSMFVIDFSIFDMFVRFICGFVITALDYFLMLAAMTYNAGIFIAVVLGFGLGHLLFGGIIASSGAEDNVESCCN